MSEASGKKAELQLGLSLEERKRNLFVVITYLPSRHRLDQDIKFCVTKVRQFLAPA